MYSYALQNPVGNTDPLGLIPFPFPFPYKPDPKIDRPGPIDQSGRTGKTGRAISGPYNKPPTVVERIGNYITKQLIRVGLDSIISGAGKFFGNARTVGIGAIFYSPALNEGEFGSDSGSLPPTDSPIHEANPLLDYNFPDPVDDPVRDSSCQ